MSSDFRPSEEQVALLRVVLAEGVLAVQTRFAEWAELVDIDRAPPGAHGLLPALSRIAEAAGVDHEWMGRLRGVYRRHWTAGQLVLQATANAAAVLESADVDFLRPADQQLASLLAEPAVFALERPRLTVRWAECERALTALEDAGWIPEPESGGPSTLRRRLTWSSRTVEHPDGSRIDLVASFNPRLIGDHRDAQLWDRAESAGAARGSVAPADLFVAALCDEIAVDGALRWVLPAGALLAEYPDGFDLAPLLDLASARLMLPALAIRMSLLNAELPSEGAALLTEEIERIARRHSPRSGAVGSLLDFGGRRRRAVARFPSAIGQIVVRHGGVRGAIRVARGAG